MAAPSHITGGVAWLPLDVMLAAWHAYSNKTISLADMRAFLGAVELRERHAGRSRPPESSKAREALRELVSGAEGRARYSLRRLRSAGLTEGAYKSRWTIEDAAPATADALDTLVEMRAVWNLGPRKKVAIPRRLLRWLARHGERSDIATAIAWCIRCFRPAGKNPKHTGSFTLASVAQLFGVDVRNVRRAKARLLEAGWFSGVAKPTWHVQRWGSTLTAGPRLSMIDPVARHQTPPLPSDNATKRPLLITDNPSVRQSMPGALRAGGVKKPTLRRVTVDDLRDPRRILDLARQAGAVAPETDVLALAARAARVADRPGAFFAQQLKRPRRSWNLTDADDDAAATLRRQLNGDDRASDYTEVAPGLHVARDQEEVERGQTAASSLARMLGVAA